ncbi:MAG: hypothetical protein R3A51_02100 [Nannocystaceae bacterium]|nr:hypothetical protein [Myxococcales bacterium]
MSHEVTTLPVKPLLTSFLDARRDGLTRRAARFYAEVIDLLCEYLDSFGIDTIDLRVEPGSRPKLPWLGSTVDVDTLLEFIDDFGEDFLVNTVAADRTFLRVSEAALRDLHRWLRGKRIPPRDTLPPGPRAGRPARRPPHTPPIGRARAVGPRLPRNERTAALTRLDPFRVG